ncbi:hypothetical protein [Fodinibius sediminis]|uniref:hypothetical protein n=1 Tax=Fodinibius sediminis TaxID=1214077 RepID=UPI001157C8D3|nr:hypothetical protein [Fodinibius sediminis]
MRQLKFIFLIITITILNACSIIGSDSNSSKIAGKWQWFRTAGGFTGQTITPDSADINHRYLILPFPFIMQIR